MLRASTLALLLFAPGTAAGGDAAALAPVYALVPARNLSGDPRATDAVLAPLKRELERRGAAFVEPADVEGALRALRIRYTDSISRADLASFGARTGADFALVTTILDFAPGTRPRVALSLRALATASGERALSSVVSLRGEDFEGLLGLGRIEDVERLVGEAVARILASFDDDGAPRARAPGRRSGRPEPPSGGQGFVRPDLDPAAIDAVAVLPLQNRSGDPDAAGHFTEFLGDAWFQGGVRVSEIAEVRSTLIAQKVRTMQYLDLRGLTEIGRAMGVRYFVLGTVERYGEEVLVMDRRFPEVEATVQLVDVEERRIVAAASVRRLGSDYEGLLGLGSVRDPIELAMRTARELVAAMGGGS